VIADLDGATLRFEGKEIRFPAIARDALATLAAAGGLLCARDLPGLDDESRLVVVRRLVREGYLRAVRPRP
jgi:hypothetical protein